MSGLLRRQLSNIILVAVALGLVVTLIVTQGVVTTGEKVSREANLLKAFREPDVSRLELQRPADQGSVGGTFTLVRTQQADSGLDHWDFEQPFQERADDIEVDDYVSTLGFAEYARRIKPEEVDRAGFGLDAPRFTVRIKMGEIEYEVLVGKATVSPAGGAYVEIRGKSAPEPGVGIISKQLVAQLDQKAAAFRARDLVPYVSVALKALTLEGRGGTRKLVRPSGPHASDGWRFDGMQGELRVDRANLDHVLSQFADIIAESFIDVDKAQAALAGADTVRIRMVPKKATTPVAVLEVGGDCPDKKGGVVALRREPDPIAGCVPRSLLEGLATPAADLVDRHPFAERPDEVESLLIERGKKRLELARKDAGFVLRGPEQGEVDGALGTQRLTELTGILGDIVTDPDKAALGLEKPAGRVVLRTVGKDAQGLVESEVKVSAADADGAVYVLRVADGGVLKLGRESARLLAPDSTLVRSRQVLKLQRNDLKRVKLDANSPAGAVSQILTRSEDGTYELTKPPGIGHDALLVSELVDSLVSLSAERWVSDEDDGSFGLRTPSASLSVDLYPHGDVKQQSISLVFGSETSGGFFASLAGDPAVFVVSKRVHETLTTWVLDRSLLMLDMAETERVALERHGKRWVFKKDGERFVLESGDLDAAKVGQIVQLLATASAEAAVHLGAARPEEGFAQPNLVVEFARLPARGEHSKPVRLSFGAGDVWRGTSVYYARRDGINCSFVIARGRLQPILDAL